MLPSRDFQDLCFRILLEKKIFEGRQLARKKFGVHKGRGINASSLIQENTS